MKLNDCTKSELIWVIKQAGKLSLGNTEYYINRALNDLQFQREMERMEKADLAIKKSRQANEKYCKLMGIKSKKVIK